MITVATEADLPLPEFVAFHQGKRIPPPLSWALPFALFQSRLSDTMAVLDCSHDAGTLPGRLLELYPNISYRHRDGPFSLPDHAFDRIFCVNTLEALDEARRQALMAEMSRALKPDGRLVLTSVGDPEAVVDLCREHGLIPTAATREPPPGPEPDTTTPLDCFGGVFSASHPAVIPPGRKVVLSLLTWNTRDVSIESARAYMSEARMLRRLGQVPFLCVCDNGSGDGTAEALRELEPGIDVPYRFILNPRNLGNSVARNQMIDYAAEVGADYLMMMDGDIEVVPFSSFAMLRHMENRGRRLGCVGADSSGHTPHRDRASQFLAGIHGTMLKATEFVAWTQYGMFRRAAFDDGVRFEEAYPFDGPGWGFEDNDLAFQMKAKGYENHHFFGMTYLHRHLHSSFPIMQRHDIDPEALYALRKRYLIDKWASNLAIDPALLGWIREDEYPQKGSV